MDEKSVIKTVCALLTSAKNGLLTAEILKDYKETEGTALPFSTFGYATFDEFLKASGKFILTETSKGIKVCAKESKASAHNTKLVKDQNGSKAKKKTGALSPRRSLRPSTIENHWNGTAYSKAYSQTQNANKSVKKTHSNQTKSNDAKQPFRNVNNNYTEMRPILKQSNIKPQHQLQQQQQPACEDQRVPTNGFSVYLDKNSRTNKNDATSNKSIGDRLSKYGGGPNSKPTNHDGAGVAKRSLQDRLKKKTDSVDVVDFVQTSPTAQDASLDADVQSIEQSVRKISSFSSRFFL